MIDWLNHAFAQYSIAWLLISAVGGGVIGAGITFFFEDYLKHRFAARRQTRQRFAVYQNPLLQSADALENQFNTILRNTGQDWLDEEYYKLSTFYKFGVFLYWVHKIEHDVGFIEMVSPDRAKEFNRRLYGPFSGISSMRRYGLTARTALPRDITRAIGEEMEGAELDGKPIGFAAFVRTYGKDAQFRKWFEPLDRMLKSLSQTSDQEYLERLVVTSFELKCLLKFLDPASTYTNGTPRNLDLVERKDLRQKLSNVVSAGRSS